MNPRKSSWFALGSLVVVQLGCGDSSVCSGQDCGGSGGTTSGPSGTTGSLTTSSGTMSSGTLSSGTLSSGSTSSGMSTGSSMSKANVNLTFTGCSPSFTGNVVVASNATSVAISTTVPPISNLQFDLHQTSGSIALSTAERVSSGDVINLVTMNSTWTNISSQQPDPISGMLTVNHYEEQAGVLDLAFTNVVLENVQDHGLCTVNGTLTTTGTSF